MTTKTPKAIEIVTAKILELLAEGVVPWQKPWHSSSGGGQRSIHGHYYRGCNAMLLACAGYQSPVWLTFNQALKLGGRVRPGEHGWPIQVWKNEVVEDEETGQRRNRWFAQGFTVFNVDQCDGLDLPEETELKEIPPNLKAEKIVKGMPNPPVIKMGGDRAAYSPMFDHVLIPKRNDFKEAGYYYSALFHELVHATAHADRLKRPLTPWLVNAEGYAKEELIAEFGSAALIHVAKLDPKVLKQSASYIKTWSERITADPRMFVNAASAADKAVNYILGVKSQYANGS